MTTRTAAAADLGIVDRPCAGAPCEACAIAGVETPAAVRRWHHHAMQARGCREVDLCAECDGAGTGADEPDDGCGDCETRRPVDHGMHRGSSFPA